MLILVSPLAFLYRATRSSEVFTAAGQVLSLVPGKLGSYLRVAYYSLTLSRCSREGFIGFGSFFSHADVELEQGYFIGGYCIIGKVRMGKGVTIGSHVSILSGKRQHGFEDLDKPIQEQGGVFTQISIGDNCWIGNNAVVMADLGTQCIVGGGSVVTKPQESYCVLAGNPARIIRKLGAD